MSRLVDYSIVSRFDYSTCRVAFSQLQYVACRFLSITVCVVSRFVDYSMCCVAFCRLQYISCRDTKSCRGIFSPIPIPISCRFLSIAVLVVSLFVDCIMCNVAFSRLQYVSCRV
jgi:hypothetical protein